MVAFLELFSLLTVLPLSTQTNDNPFLYYFLGHGFGFIVFGICSSLYFEELKNYSGKHGEEAAYALTYSGKTAEHHISKGASDGAKGARLGMGFGNLAFIILSISLGIPYWGILNFAISALTGLLLIFVFVAFLMFRHYRKLKIKN